MSQRPGTNKGIIVMGTDDKINGFCSVLSPYSEADVEKEALIKTAQLNITKLRKGAKSPQPVSVLAPSCATVFVTTTHCPNNT
jgi:hypothetical protein